MAMVEVAIAIQGDGVAYKDFDEGTTLGQIRALLDRNPTLEFRVQGEEVEDDYVVKSGDILVGTQDAKGGIA
jgi:hypothetical protein